MKNPFNDTHRSEHCCNCNIYDINLCKNCHYYIDDDYIDNILGDYDYCIDHDCDEDLLELNTCEDCEFYGDNVYVGKNGELMNRCLKCCEN